MKPVSHIAFLMILFIQAGCVTLYKPNVIHSPLLKEKGELNTSASLGISGSGLYNCQAAYALSNHTGIILDGMYHQRRTDKGDSTVQKLHMLFAETGAGYFTTFGPKKNGLFQCYSGGGYGSTTDKSNKSNPDNPELNAKYFNLFIQPGVAFINKDFSVAFDIRTNYVHMYRIHAYLYDQFEWWNTDFRFHSDTSLNFVNLEPTLTIKAGGARLKGIFQCGLTIPAIRSNSYFMVNSSALLGFPLIKFSVGLNYSFRKK